MTAFLKTRPLAGIASLVFALLTTQIVDGFVASNAKARMNPSPTTNPYRSEVRPARRDYYGDYDDDSDWSRPNSRRDRNDNYNDDSDWNRPNQRRERNNGSRDRSHGSKQRNQSGRNTDRYDRRNSHGSQRRGGSSRSESSQSRNERRPPPTQESAAEITPTNAHFFSKKALSDPTFYRHESEEETDTQEVYQALCQGAGITRPSRIQSLAWPQILSGKHTIVADQTGSGKTCAYLIPCLLRAMQTPSMKRNGSPKVLILAPTAELADQIQSVCSKISQTGPKFSTMVVTANGKYTTSIRDQIRMIQRKPVDILISTPGRISTILRTRNSGLDLSHVQSIVLDEVDILMIDETFGPQLRTVGAAAPVLDKTQFVFVTATLPDSIVQTISNEFPGVVKVTGPGLHRVAPSLKETLVDVSVPSDSNRNDELCFDIKAKQLLKALRQNRCRRTLVFCNTVESCRGVENLLNRKDRHGRIFEVLAYHSAMTPEARNANLQVFAKGRKDDKNENVDYILIW